VILLLVFDYLPPQQGVQLFESTRWLLFDCTHVMVSFAAWKFLLGMVMTFIFILLFDKRTSERLFDIVYFFTMSLEGFLLQETDV
jgi:hypothetical protein